MLNDIATQVRSLGLPATMLPVIGDEPCGASVAAAPKPAAKPTKVVVPPKKAPISKKICKAPKSVVAQPAQTATAACESIADGNPTANDSSPPPTASPREVGIAPDAMRHFHWRAPVNFTPSVAGTLVRNDGGLPYIEYELRSEADRDKGVLLRVYGDMHMLERLNRRNPHMVDGIFSLFEWSDTADSYLYGTLYLGPCDAQCTLGWYPTTMSAAESSGWNWIMSIPGGGAFTFVPIKRKEPTVTIEVR